MVDRQFADADLARLYDIFCSWEYRDDLEFYLPLVLSARRVLDVGCGTGMLLHRAREAGHTGRLCGLDPGAGMLAQARRRTDIEWVLGDLRSVARDAAFDAEFDLVVMTGHAFQVFVTDDELRDALAAIRSALAAGGRFAFETRNPAAREWLRWTPEYAVEVAESSGAVYRMSHDVRLPVEGDLVSFTTTFTGPGLGDPSGLGGVGGARRSQSTLRFLDAEALAGFLADAGLVIEEQYGDWDRTPLTHASPEIITLARRAPSQV